MNIVDFEYLEGDIAPASASNAGIDADASILFQGDQSLRNVYNVYAVDVQASSVKPSAPA